MPEKRKHHYVPAFQLALFTADGTKDGDFYVFDLDRKIIRTSTPHNEAHKANLYTPDEGALAGTSDPAAARSQFEDFLAGMESEIAPIIKQIVKTGMLPTDLSHRKSIFEFVATSIFRTPEFLQQANANAMQFAQQFALRTLRSDEMWKQHQARKAAEGKPVDDSERAKLIGLFQKHPHAVAVNRGSILETMPKAIELAVPLLERRQWRLEVLAPENGELALPNCPVTVFQSSGVVPYDLQCVLAKDTLILLPLSPCTLLVSHNVRHIELNPPNKILPTAAAHANTAAFDSLKQRGKVDDKVACMFARGPDFPMVASNNTITTFSELFPEFNIGPR